MNARLGKLWRGLTGLRDLPGPLLAKEMLVSSRRMRYYVLRFAYAGALALFIMTVWLGVVEGSAAWSAGYRAQQMPELGKKLSCYIVWFQFVGSQLVAVVLLSGAISEEIGRRTLVPILTTPLPFWKIVTGKFAGKLLHVGLLLALSLPLLGAARVLGGVPWDYVLSGACISVTAAMFSGAAATFFSVLCRRPLLAILATGAVGLGVFGILGGVLLLAATIISALAGGSALAVALYPNPYAAMVYQTVVLLDPSRRMGLFFWPGHCAVMLAATAGVLAMTTALLRRSGVRKALGPDGPAAPPLPPRAGLPVLAPIEEADRAPPRRRWRPRGWNLRNLTGSPVFWREMRKPLLRDKVVQIVVVCAVLFYLLYVYAILGAGGQLGEGGTHAAFLAAFLVVAMFCVAVDAATTIAPEKQSRTLVGLLCTPLSDWHVLLGKLGGTMFRCLPVWLLLAGHVLVFVLARVLHPLVIVHVAILVASTTVFLAGMGAYFSARLRRTTSAVLATVGAGLLLWAVAPGVAGMVGRAFGDREAAELLEYVNPVSQAAVVAQAACRGWQPHYGSWGYFKGGAGLVTALLFCVGLGYAGVGALLAWRAKVLLRRKVFDE